MKYSMFENIKYVYQAVFKKSPKSKLYIFVSVFTELLTPLLVSITTALVVYMLVESVDIAFYVSIIIAIVLVTMVLEVFKSVSKTKYDFENTFTRVRNFFVELSMFQITTDYVNVEPKEKQRKMTKAYEAINSNWIGIELMMKYTPPLIINFIGMIIYGGFVLIYAPIVLVVLLVMSIANFILTKKANDYLKRTREQANQEFAEQYYLSEDSTNPNYGKDIRLFNIGKWFNELLVNLTKRRVVVEGKVRKKFFIANISNTTFLAIRDIIAYITLLALVIEGVINLSTFTFMIGIISGFSLWLNNFVDAFNNLRVANVGVNEYREFVTLENEFNHGEGYPINKLQHPIKIEFKNVGFTYPESTEPTITGLNLTIEAGEKIALVGHNGAGKTTIVKLLCGLYKPTEGQILLNGIDIQEFNIDDYQQLIGVMFQESQPLSLTIENNISCRPEGEVDKDKLVNVMKDADIYDKVMSLDKKEGTFITKMFDDEGIRLSGGETQKLFLARTLYKNAPILVLDEPTAALDPIAEENMYKKYEGLSKGNTCLFISHRLASTRFCDRIIYLENGEIIQEGTHDDLIDINGPYQDVFNIQAQYYKEETI